MRDLWRPSAIAIALAVPLATFSAPTLAAEANTKTAASSSTIGEVFITATKRSENIQDVPIAVTAFTAQMLRLPGATG